jgi:hypothetical protein
MKKGILISLSCGLLVAGAAFADQPTVNITAPTGTVFVSSFPFSTNVVLQISHPTGELKNLQVFNLEVSQISPVSTPFTSLTGVIGNPFDNNNACTPQMAPVNGVSACSVNSGIATVSVMWQVQSAGTYSMKATLKHQGDTGEDTQEVTFNLLVSVEYPAPPAIANAYINGNPTLKKAAPTVRGCVVSQIAQLHGQTQKSGPAPGPYNNALVQSDVTAFWPACSQQ